MVEIKQEKKMKVEEDSVKEEIKEENVGNDGEDEGRNLQTTRAMQEVY